MEGKIYEIEGTVFRIDEDVQEFGPYFKKRSLILHQRKTYKEKTYEDFIEFDFVNDMIYKLDAASVGNKVRISFVIQGKESKKQAGRYFSTLKAIRIDVEDNPFRWGAQ